MHTDRATSGSTPSSEDVRSGTVTTSDSATDAHGNGQYAEVLAKGIPTATLVRWEGVGHEQPPQLVPELTRLVTQHIDAAS